MRRSLLTFVIAVCAAFAQAPYTEDFASRGPDSLSLSIDIVKDGIRAWRFGDSGAAYLLDKGRQELLELRPDIRSREDIARTSLYLGLANLFMSLSKDDEEAFNRAYRHFFSLTKMDVEQWSNEGGYYAGLGYLLNDSRDVLNLSRALSLFEGVILGGGEHRREDSKIMLGLVQLKMAELRFTSGDVDVSAELRDAMRTVYGLEGKRAASIRENARLGLATLALRHWLDSKELGLADTTATRLEIIEHASILSKSEKSLIRARALSMLLVVDGLEEGEEISTHPLDELPFMADERIPPVQLRRSLLTSPDGIGDFYLGWTYLYENSLNRAWYHFIDAMHSADDSTIYAHSALRLAEINTVFRLTGHDDSLSSGMTLEQAIDPWNPYGRRLSRRAIRRGKSILLQSENSAYPDSSSLLPALYEIEVTPDERPYEYVDMARFLIERYAGEYDHQLSSKGLSTGFSMLRDMADNHDSNIARLFLGLYSLYFSMYHGDSVSMEEGREYLRNVGGKLGMEAGFIEGISYYVLDDSTQARNIWEKLSEKGYMRAAYMLNSFIDVPQDRANLLGKILLTIGDNEPKLREEIEWELEEMDVSPAEELDPFPRYVPVKGDRFFEDMMTSMDSGYYIPSQEVRRWDLYSDWAFTLPLLETIDMKDFLRW